MSKYTTEVRFICENKAGYIESVGGSKVNEVIGKAWNKIFDRFDIFDEAYREVLCRKILKHFYTREIGFETAGLWVLKLNTKMEEIMPYYNRLYESELLEFNPLYTKNLKIEHKGKGSNDESSDTAYSGVTTANNETQEITNGKGSTSSSGKELFSDTPQGGIGNIEDMSYLTNATLTSAKGENESESTGSVTNAGTVSDKNDTKFTRSAGSTDEYVDLISGYEGKSASELVLEFRSMLINIDMMVIGELEELFMQLW